MKSFEKKQEEKAWQLYLTKYQHMTKENYTDFEDFYNPRKLKTESKSEKEILNDVQNILSAFKKEKE